MLWTKVSNKWHVLLYNRIFPVMGFVCNFHFSLERLAPAGLCEVEKPARPWSIVFETWRVNTISWASTALSNLLDIGQGKSQWIAKVFGYKRGLVYQTTWAIIGLPTYTKFCYGLVMVSWRLPVCLVSLPLSRLWCAVCCTSLTLKILNQSVVYVGLSTRMLFFHANELFPLEMILYIF